MRTELAAPAAPVTTWQVVVGLARISKISVYLHFFPWALAALLLSADALDRPGALAAMVLFLLSSAGIVAATAALDDIVGFRNGSDAANYTRPGFRRDIRRKPLLSGDLTLRQATVFAVASEAFAFATGFAAFAVLGWDVPVSAVVIFVLCAVLGPQYSAGLRFSFHVYGSELLLGIGTIGGLLFPFLAVQNHWTWAATLQGVLMGLWLVMLVSCSNVGDVEGDARVGRRTLPVAAPRWVVKAVLVAYLTISVVTIALLPAATDTPWWTVLALLPATALHVAQIHLAILRDRWRQARIAAFVAYDLGFLGLVALDLYAR
ncbi:UbiA family prenyltransferase [Actinoplanes aureus]|jgi:1,4-dihydroxy-2-naphthoate octaprenyltransferase|uniref:UbiA prenyltransferase family protein n=1 Tax=Actinoplanes aureus TaxID=2792083 RepID=A0A931CHH0_9ACTN|nr:UbiA family prenyltransferase [Actinoplanes aureus]MBG0566546.1 UbiA prenyltransferase family protein [Actinoplanes aureus]